MLFKFLSKLARKNEGATAIEFSLLVIPFTLVTLAIIELSIMYAAATLLEAATASGARLVRTGQIQQASGDPETMFRESVCDYATVLINCNNIVVEALPMTSFTDYASMQPQYDEDGNMVPQGFSAGASNEKILIRVSYRYKMMTPVIGPLLTGPTSSRLFMSTIVFENEPYEFESS